MEMPSQVVLFKLLNVTGFVPSLTPVRDHFRCTVTAAWVFMPLLSDRSESKLELTVRLLPCVFIAGYKGRKVQ